MIRLQGLKSSGHVVHSFRFLTVYVSIVLTAPLFPGTVAADTLGDAYAKEFTFLKAQKGELQQRLNRERRGRVNAVEAARREVETLQTRFIELTTAVDQERQSLENLQAESGDRQNAVQLIENVESQISSTLGEAGLAPPETLPMEQRLVSAFRAAAQLSDQWSSMTKDTGTYYLADGTRAEGELIRVGNVASYAQGEKGAGALVPVGQGKFSLWPQTGSTASARALAAGDLPASVSVFIYENDQQAITPPSEKSLQDIIESGGIVGYVILSLGALGLLFAFLRCFILLFSGSNALRVVRRATKALRQDDYEKACGLMRKARGSAGRVLKDITEHATQCRERLDDVIAESILREGSRLDRFGMMILVIAAVAPLLGLLGTVSGMIDTFDVITEFGTGDPKLLAGGISVALVTTMLGLSVAIPLVLIGNLLTGWATRVKDRMERSAILSANAFALYRAQNRAQRVRRV